MGNSDQVSAFEYLCFSIMPDKTEMRTRGAGADDVESTLVDQPEETGEKEKKWWTGYVSVLGCTMSKIHAAAIGILVIVVLVIVVIVVIAMNKKGPVCPDGTWMDNPLKRPFSVALTTAITDNVRVEGQLKICGQDVGCCTTNKFVFEAPTLVKLEEHANCTKFEMNKEKNMTIKVLNDDPDKVKIERVVMVLDNGASFHGWPPRDLAQSTWSQDILLRALNLEQNTLMKVNFKREQAETKHTSIDGARIELKRSGESVAECRSNPLPGNPLPGKNRGTFELDDLKTLGTCFANSVRGASDTLKIRLLTPDTCMPYKVTRIIVQSYEEEEENSAWSVKLKDQDGEDDGWMLATYDDDY